MGTRLFRVQFDSGRFSFVKAFNRADAARKAKRQSTKEFFTPPGEVDYITIADEDVTIFD